MGHPLLSYWQGYYYTIIHSAFADLGGGREIGFIGFLNNGLVNHRQIQMPGC